MRKIVLLAAALSLAGCYETPGTGELFMSSAEKDAKDDAACRRYGAVPGTDVYINCRVQQDQTRANVKSTLAAASIAQNQTCTTYGNSVSCY